MVPRHAQADIDFTVPASCIQIKPHYIPGSHCAFLEDNILFAVLCGRLHAIEASKKRDLEREQDYPIMR